MSDKPAASPSEELKRIIESAQRLGIEMKEDEAIQWLTAITAAQYETNIVVDAQTGVFGHRITMLDFSPEELAHFRKIGELVGFADEPELVETALSISGSAAQSKIQTYPGDADYFERINIRTPTRAEACQVLARVMRQKAIDTLTGPTYQLLEVKFGSFPQDGLRDGKPIKGGTPISWKAAELQAGRFEIFLADGQARDICWEDVAVQPGWCKLDWVVADPVHKHLVNASNMLDVTWEAPDGKITPLDGYLDPYFQEVYLEAESIPLFTKLARHVSSDALEDYVVALEKEIKKYLTKDLNYGKVAKRMYNIFRLTGRYQEAAFLRELFDEPTTVLYQVWSLIRTIDDCFAPGSSITLEDLLSQADELILTVVKVMEGAEEVEIVRQLLRLRDILSHETYGHGLSPLAEAARAEVINIVNNFFYEKMIGVPSIKAYMDQMSAH